MSESISTEQFHKITAKGNPRRKHTPGVMNKTERLFADTMVIAVGSGEILAWWFEQWTFKLGDDCRYTPDFILMHADGSLEAVEIKGHIEEDALVKMRWFAREFPIPLRCVAWTRAKGWYELRTFNQEQA